LRLSLLLAGIAALGADVSSVNAQARLVIRITETGIPPPAPVQFEVLDGSPGDVDPFVGDVGVALAYVSPTGFNLTGLVDARQFLAFASHGSVIEFTEGAVANVSGAELNSVVTLATTYFYPDAPIPPPNYAAANLLGSFQGPPPGPVGASVQLTCGEPSLVFPDVVVCNVSLASTGIGAPGVGAYVRGTPFAANSGWIRILPDRTFTAHCMRLECSVSTIGATLLFPDSAESMVIGEPPPPTGACCVEDLCVVESEFMCDAQGGDYQGDGSACEFAGCACVSAEFARHTPLGSTLDTCNLSVTSTTDLINSASFKSFHVQDSSGQTGYRGLTVFGDNATIDPILSQIQVGDVISLGGVTAEFNGVFELEDDAGAGIPLLLNSVFSGSPVSPRFITLADLQPGALSAELLESVLVRTQCVTFQQTGVFAGVTNYVIQAGTATALARVGTTALDLVNQPIPSGPVHLTGILTQFDTTVPRNGDYQILLRGLADIQQCTSDECMTCPGDMNASVTLNGADISEFISCYLSSVGGSPSHGCGCVDMNGDGFVTPLDITDPWQGFTSSLLAHSSCP
jgi:hypothetical protein